MDYSDDLIYRPDGDLDINNEFAKIYSGTIETMLPDGSKYTQIIVPQNLILIQAYFDYIIGNLNARINEQEFRIIFPNKAIAEMFLRMYSLDSFEIHHGKTQYFEVLPQEFNEIIDGLREKATGFTVTETDSATDIKDLMVNSFAHDFSTNEINSTKASQISDAVERSTNTIYTSTFRIDNDTLKLLLATFTLLPLKGEVQLHSVAGRPVNQLSEVENKLGVIMFFVLLEMSQSYPNKKLTLNSSGAANLYRALGIKDSERYGIVLKRINN